MSQSVPSLKLEWQRVMQIIMRKETSYDKQQMEQHNQCQIKMSSQIQINVEEQSKGFELFYWDARSGHSWMTNLINQLSDVHLFPYHPFQTNAISPSQFMNALLAPTTPPTEQPACRQQSRQQFTHQQHEYVFFNSLPSESLIISSMQQIDDNCVMFVARCFHGQIVYVSLNEKGRKKREILERFGRVMRGRVLHVVVDSIDYGPGEGGRITLHELEAITESVDCIYLLRETDSNLPLDSDDYVRYQIYYNSLLKKYTHHSQFPYLLTTLPTLIQSLLLYFFTLMREQLPLLHFAFYNELTLIKGVIQLNYKRKLQRQQNENYELTHFQDFIHSHHYITQQMLDYSLQQNLFHFASKLPASRHCYYCKVYKNANKSTLYTCGRCQTDHSVIIPLCPECMEPFHQIKDRLKIVENFKNCNKTSQKNEKQEKMAGQSWVGINFQQKNTNNKPQTQQKRSKHFTSRLAGKSRCSKKITHVSKKKKLHLTPDQLSNLKQLQQSSQRLFSIFRQFKNLKSLYKPSLTHLANQHELKYQLKSQWDFMKAMDIELGKQIEMFEGEVMMAVYPHDQVKEEEGIDEERFGRMVKIQHVEDGEGQELEVVLPMVKIEQESGESYYDDCLNNNYNSHHLQKITDLRGD